MMIKPRRQGAHPSQSVLPAEGLSDSQVCVLFLWSQRNLLIRKMPILLCLYFFSCSRRILIQCKWDFSVNWREPVKIMGWFIPALDSAGNKPKFSTLTHDFGSPAHEREAWSLSSVPLSLGPLRWHIWGWYNFEFLCELGICFWNLTSTRSDNFCYFEQTEDPAEAGEGSAEREPGVTNP